MGKQTYHVRLSEADKKAIKAHLRSKKNSVESKTHGKILLALDENRDDKLPSKIAIAKQLGVCEQTVSKVRKRFATQGLKGALERKLRAEPAIASIVTGEVEAHIIAVCCSTPPEGYSRWSMKMIASKIVLDKRIDAISDETVRKVLKKRNLSRF